MDFIYSLVLGIVEGLTEFLPISSTGHLLIASALLNFPSTTNRLTFDIFIQIGAVVAVIVYYLPDLVEKVRRVPSDKVVQRFWLNLLIAFIPAAVVGLLIEKPLDQMMAQATVLPSVIATTLIIGGIIFLIIENRPRTETTHALEQVTIRQAILIGLAQAVAIVPGVSRSGASIVGGLLVGLDRVIAVEFSFYLFILTLGAATIYKLYSALRQEQLSINQAPLLMGGTFMAFLVSYVSITWLMRYVTTHNFKAFGIYRIVVGILIFLLLIFTPIL